MMSFLGFGRAGAGAALRAGALGFATDGRLGSRFADGADASDGDLGAVAGDDFAGGVARGAGGCSTGIAAAGGVEGAGEGVAGAAAVGAEGAEGLVVGAVAEGAGAGEGGARPGAVTVGEVAEGVGAA